MCYNNNKVKLNIRIGWDYMSTMDAQDDLPEDYEQLRTSLNRTSNWRERLEAVEKLGQYQHKKIIDMLTHRMNSDTVFQVQEAAFRKLRALGVDVQLPPKHQGSLIKGLTKILIRIKKSLPEGHTYEQFKAKLQKMRVDIYDAYEGDKGEQFDEWLESTWASLSTR
jgi:queuine/archaeosine tRNA-ribosyltransferase